MTRTASLLGLLLAALLLGCGAEDLPTQTDAQDTARGGRDVAVTPAVDAGIDAAEDAPVATDVLIDDAFTRPDLGPADAGVDASEDTDTERDTAEPMDAPAPLPDVDSALALSVVQAARDALDDYCNCGACVEQGFSSAAACREEVFEGGFELNDCKVAVIEELGRQAESYLRCMKAAFDAGRDCTPECSAVECIGCQSAFGRAWSACQREHPTPYARLTQCDEA
jgi:hypothetical protein